MLSFKEAIFQKKEEKKVKINKCTKFYKYNNLLSKHKKKSKIMQIFSMGIGTSLLQTWRQLPILLQCGESGCTWPNAQIDKGHLFLSTKMINLPIE